jgi:hypothetical protein
MASLLLRPTQLKRDKWNGRCCFEAGEYSIWNCDLKDRKIQNHEWPKIVEFGSNGKYISGII